MAQWVKLVTAKPDDVFVSQDREKQTPSRCCMTFTHIP